MNSGRTLEEVLNFSRTIEYQESGFLPAGGGYLLLFAGFLLVLGIFLTYKYGRVEAIVLVPLSIAMVFLVGAHHQFSVSSANADLQDAKKLEWEREYVDPYLRSLPVTRTEEFQSFRYDYELENEGAPRTRDTQSREVYEKPIQLELPNDKKMLVWAEVIYEPALKADVMEYKYLSTELRFDERHWVYKEAGYQDVKIYTNKP